MSTTETTIGTLVVCLALGYMITFMSNTYPHRWQTWQGWLLTSAALPVGFVILMSIGAILG